MLSVKNNAMTFAILARRKPNKLSSFLLFSFFPVLYHYLAQLLFWNIWVSIGSIFQTPVQLGLYLSCFWTSLSKISSSTMFACWMFFLVFITQSVGLFNVFVTMRIFFVSLIAGNVCMCSLKTAFLYLTSPLSIFE